MPVHDLRDALEAQAGHFCDGPERHPSRTRGTDRVVPALPAVGVLSDGSGKRLGIGHGLSLGNLTCSRNSSIKLDMLILNIEGQPFVQAVRLDDPSPGYAEKYVQVVRKYIDPSAVLRYAEVDVSSVAEYGPNEIAAMLSEDTQEEQGLLTDLPQRWETA